MKKKKILEKFEIEINFRNQIIENFCLEIYRVQWEVDLPGRGNTEHFSGQFKWHTEHTEPFTQLTATKDKSCFKM